MSMPRYYHFFDVEVLLTEMLNSPLPLDLEALCRERLILLLRLLCLFRGCDLEKATRDIKTKSNPWFIKMTRKGRPRAGWYPIPHLGQTPCDPQFWLLEYLDLTRDFDGPQLFCSLPSDQGRHPLKADTINSITTKYLRDRGMTEWSAHATRGAAATCLIKRGVAPQVVQALGDWQSTDTFMKFYNRILATSEPHVQCLVQG